MMFQVDSHMEISGSLQTKCYIKGYDHFMELATDTGSTFWATKQLGDGEGFFIGSTVIFSWSNR
ncbi:hypothetical protein [Bacillus sp. V2I10]|uniref:hypothetical protein n=1 Tax=Bacillus sp. V2I10 TaxID=3042276 RepID=UPI0027883C3F|nr:hypothetical protein [Bacillus sp. V2I10]MDQ0859770.1 hypothetical protein [Bacillus sp. V2I10]